MGGIPAVGPLADFQGGPGRAVTTNIAESIRRRERNRLRLDGEGLQVYYSQTSMAFERAQCIMHQIAPRTLPAQRQGPFGFFAFREKFKKNPDALFQEALAYLRESGFRVTKPREVIVRSAISFAEPFHAEDLLAKAREVDRLISLATIYRTLPMMLDSHLIREVELNREHRYYEVNREQSPAAFHIVCADCRQVIQVQDECITLRERFLANSMGFSPLKLTVRIEATCLDLREKGSCQRRDRVTDNAALAKAPVGNPS